MPIFIMGMNYRGPRPNFDETLDERNSEVMRVLDAAGGSIVGFYRTQGRFDAVAIMEMPDAESMQAFNIANQSEHWTIETMRAFTMDEYPEIWTKASALLKKAGVS